MIEFWNALLPDAEFQSAEPWLARLWEASLVAAIIVPLVWLLLRSIHSISPRFQAWVWRLVCCKLLVVLLWPTPIELAILPAPQPIAVSPPVVAEKLPPIEVPDNSIYTPVESGPVVAPDNMAEVKTGPSFPNKASPSWPTALLACWTVGFVGCVLLIVRQFAQVAALRRASQPCDDPELQTYLQEGAARLQVRRLPQLRISTSPTVPLLAGIIRPVILLPVEREKFSPTELRLMIEHELGHMKRHDLLWNWLPALVTLALYFHPAIWLLRRVWGDVQEAACDELLIQRQAARPAEYGHLLLKLSRNTSVAAHGVSTAGILGNYRTLKRRIESMGRVRNFSQRRLVVAALTIAAVSLLAVVPWRLVAEEGTKAADASEKNATTKETNQETDASKAAKNGDKNRAKGALADNPDKELIRKSAKNLQELMLAMYDFYDIADHFPPAKSGYAYDEINGTTYDAPHLSWRVRLLPLLGKKDLYSKFNLYEPWDSEHNKKLIPLMPDVFRAPGSKAAAGKTNYLGIVGAHAAFPSKGSNRSGNFRDGISNSIALVEVPDSLAVEWTRPDDFPIDRRDLVKSLVDFRKGGFLVIFADNGPAFIDNDISEEQLHTRMTIDGRDLHGEEIKIHRLPNPRSDKGW